MDFKELLSHLHLTDFVVLDLETTGLDPRNDGITEISAYRFENGKPKTNYTTLVNPAMRIPANIVELTGITNGMVKNAPAIDEVLNELREFIGHSPIIGHNIGFDLRFINNRFSLANIPELDNHAYDTLFLARSFLFFHHEFTLSAVSQYFQLDTGNAHRATADTLNTGQVFVKLVREVASYPLSIIQDIYNTVKHSDIYNLYLFKHIVDISLELRMVNGLIDSVIQKEMKSFIFDHKTENGDQNITSSPSEWMVDDGIIAQKWDGYETRQSQVDLAEDTYQSFDENSLLLAEAGTGLGKSVAYLTAGILHRKKTDIPLLVSTYTKHLQDQLFYKDIPKLAKIIDMDVSAILVKGRNNYICLTRLEHLLSNSSTYLNKSDCENILPILIWRHFTETGDISDCHGFKIRAASKIWGMIRSEKGYCTTFRCRQHDGCFVGRIREYLHKADIIVVNHSLLLIDFLQEMSNLPDTYSFVIDEGHNLEQAARDQLINRISDYSFYDILKVFSNKESKYNTSLRKIAIDSEVIGNIYEQLIEESNRLSITISSFFREYASSKESGMQEHPQYEYRVIYTNGDLEFADINPDPARIISSLSDFGRSLDLLVNSLEEVDDRSLSFVSQESVLIQEKLSALITIMQRVTNIDSQDVVWSSFIKQRDNIQANLNCAPKDVSHLISEGILARKAGGLICSATLTVEDQFEYLKTCLGINLIDHEKQIQEKIYYSPFSYEDQVKLFIGTGNAAVQSREYLHGVAHHIDTLSKEIPGRMLVLCTSYDQTRMLQEFLIQPIGRDEDRKLFVQNSGKGRQALIQGYLSNPRAILIGTTSFWEGVDFPGDNLKMLIIIKLPFANPGDPIVKAKIDEFTSSGRNAFMEFQVPDATVKLKQGFGRLIRSLNDTGICVITDPRLHKSRYGKIMLDSLPVESQKYTMIDSVIRASRKFLKS